MVDIARLSGVSIGTVDRVIHNRGRVSLETRQKVNEAIRELNYKPNILARSLRLQASIKTAVLLPDHVQDEYWKLSINGINSEIGKWSHYGLNVQIQTYDPYQPDSFRSAVNAIIKDKVDGVAIAPVFQELTRGFLQHLRDQEIPFALFDSNIPEMLPLSFAGQDLYASGRLAAELLMTATHGEGKLIVIHMKEDLTVAPHIREKERGLLSFMQDVNKEALVFSLNPAKSGFRSHLQQILSDHEVRAIYATNSWGTAEVGRMLQQSGRNDVVFVGYDLLADNIRLLRAGIIRFLINQNPGRMARQALGNLFTHLVLGQQVPAVELFPLDVLTRENVDSYLRYQI